MHTKGVASFEKCVQQIDEKRKWEAFMERENNKRRSNKKSKQVFSEKKKMEERKTLKQRNEMTRYDMRRLDATDDPRPMSVSLQPLNTTIPWKITKKK